MLTLSLALLAAQGTHALSRSHDAFGLAVLKAVAKPGQNTVVSPNNVLYALSGLLPASSGASRSALENALDTSADDLRTLKTVFTASGGEGAQLEVAAAAWVDDQITPERSYMQTVERDLGFSIRVLDLQSSSGPATINGWVRQATHDKIPSIVGQLPNLARLVLTSALYFKAPWQSRMHAIEDPLLFGPEKKEVKSFGTTAIMGQLDRPSYRAVFVPLKGDCVAEFYVPKGDNTPEGIAKGALEPHALVERTNTVLRLPYWKTEFNGSLKGALKSSGLAPVFEPRGELRAIADDAYVMDVFHRTWVDVNEKGIEAAAATAVVVGVTSAPADPKVFTVDRPFFFVLRNNSSGATLFMGFVHEPTSA
jgi:serpin B